METTKAREVLEPVLHVTSRQVKTYNQSSFAGVQLNFFFFTYGCAVVPAPFIEEMAMSFLM